MNKIVELIHSNRGIKQAVLREAKRDGVPMTQQALNEWKKLRNGVPPKRVHIVARATGLKFHTIRPDIFPRGT